MKYIGLLDCNNFFVSCERLFRPDLRTVPTVVLSSNDGCVVARSKEIKEMGIPMGVPYFKVKDELKDANAAVFSSNFPLYRDISNRVMETLKKEVGFVEQYSVDEAFFELSTEEGSVVDTLKHIKNIVESSVGMPVSIGAAKTKTIAKYASEVGKKGEGMAFMVGEVWERATKELFVNEIWGIGKQTSQKMKEKGIYTVSDFLSVDRSQIDSLFGVAGLRMHDELSERSVYKLGSNRASQKSIMSTRSFKETTTSQAVVEDALAYHISHAAEELRLMGMKAGKITVMAHTSRFGDWLMRGGTKDVYLDVPSNDTRKLLKESLTLFRSFYEVGVPYKKAGIVLSDLISSDIKQGDLFVGEEISDSSSEVMNTIDMLNKRFGRETVTIGRNFSGKKWKTSKEFVSPCYTTNWSELREVSARVPTTSTMT